MSILQEILVWTQSLPLWQSDAVARLLAKQTLTADDLEDLYALLKVEHGIPDSKDRKPKPLTADQIPAPVKATTHIELHAMKNMRHVNAVAENQHLAFGTAGLRSQGLLDVFAPTIWQSHRNPTAGRLFLGDPVVLERTLFL